MDTTLVKSDSPEDCVCRCCSKSFLADQLHSLFEYTNEETEIYKILMILAPISICRNDGEHRRITEALSFAQFLSFKDSPKSCAQGVESKH